MYEGEGMPVISWVLEFLMDLLSQPESMNTMDILIFDFQRHFQRLHGSTAGLVGIFSVKLGCRCLSLS